jgi:hypothetical protein
MDGTRMKTAVTSLGIVCLLLLSACSIGDSDSNDPTATVTSAATTPASPTATTANETETRPPSPTATGTTETASPTGTATGASASPEATQAGLDPELADEIDEIEQQTEDIRELDLLEPVPISVISREELRQNLIDDVNADYSQEEADEDAQELWLLRLIDDPTIDLYQFQIDLLSEQVLGYYDPERDEMFIVSDADGLSGLAEFTLSHELVHAIQDQHYDLQKVRFYDQGDNDRDTAAVALIEGDAQLAQTQYAQTMDPSELIDMLGEAGSLSSEVVDNAPPYLRESLYFPYEQGLKFVQTLYSEDGFATLDQAFTDPPTSTEQILHPEKYLDERDDPQNVELPDLNSALGDGWEQRDTDSLGEFDLSVLLRENGADDYAEAAAGWDGGRYAFYAGDSGELMVVKTVWDNPAEATEFHDAMLTTLAGPLDSDIGDAGQGRLLGLRQIDDAVWFVTSTDRATVEAALAAIGE